MDPLESITTCLRKPFQFSGSASQSALWRLAALALWAFSANPVLADASAPVVAAFEACAIPDEPIAARLGRLANAGWHTADDTPQTRALRTILFMLRFPLALESMRAEDVATLKSAVAEPSPLEWPPYIVPTLEEVVGAPSPFRADLEHPGTAALLRVNISYQSDLGDPGRLHCLMMLAVPFDQESHDQLLKAFGPSRATEVLLPFNQVDTFQYERTLPDMVTPVRSFLRIDIFSSATTLNAVAVAAGSPMIPWATIKVDSGLVPLEATP